MCLTFFRLTGASDFQSRQAKFSTAWVVARLPEDRITKIRSPGTSKVCTLVAERTSSTPALVRVSPANTSPSFTLIATQ